MEQTAAPGQALTEHLPPLSAHEAIVEANRCLFCYDAPCTHACPTHIDIPRFIKKISTDNLIGSARTILDANLLGSTCARVCPVQELCEGACVMGAEHKPIMIGRLQRYATDYVRQRGIDVIYAGHPTGKRVAVVGAGPAGLSCAGELARFGHTVTVFEKRPLAGGLSTYGIIALREPVDASLFEVEMIKRLGVTIETGHELGGNLKLDDLRGDYQAVFLSVGLGATPALGVPNEEHIIDGLEYIEQSKLNPEGMHIGRNVVIIGAGNTAIDCATIAKRLGADRVTMVYRRTDREMTAYPHEYEFVKNEGVEFRFLTQPIAVVVEDGKLTGLRCRQMRLAEPDASGRLSPELVPNTDFILPADQVVKAIGQEKPAIAQALGLATEKGYLKVDDAFMTSIPQVYSGGDCIRAKGAASTVMAVQDGKLAAQSIHRSLTHG